MIRKMIITTLGIIKMQGSYFLMPKDSHISRYLKIKVLKLNKKVHYIHP